VRRLFQGHFDKVCAVCVFSYCCWTAYIYYCKKVVSSERFASQMNCNYVWHSTLTVGANCTFSNRDFLQRFIDMKSQEKLYNCNTRRHPVKYICLPGCHIQTLKRTLVCNLKDIRHHRSNGDCLQGKRGNYQVCSVQYCVQQLCRVQCTHIWTDLTVLWIGFCLTGPISLCLDSFLCMYVLSLMTVYCMHV